MASPGLEPETFSVLD